MVRTVPSPRRLATFLPTALLLAWAGVASAQTTTFTYQGRLTENGGLASGSYDLQFKLFDTVTLGTGTQQGGTVVVPAVQVTGGLFTVPLDFGPGVFPGADRFLEIAVKKVSDPGFSTLGPRQPLSSNPYAIRSLAAGQADGLSLACVSCVTSSQVQSVQGAQVTGPIAGSQITGTIPVASVPAGSPSYIQNGTSPQASADFNISGNGVAAILDASTQFNLGGSRILGTPGTNNFAVGLSAGASNTTGTANTFVGQNAGRDNLTGSSNEFFGFNAGRSTTTGGNNVFIGDAAGIANVTGSSNVIIGDLAGFNTNASFNAFFGDRAGGNNTSGQSNAFFGYRAGVGSGATSNNAYFGALAGSNTTGGGANAFFGVNTGLGMTTGTSNTLVGANANIVNGLDHATAIGADAVAGTSSTIVLGRTTDLTQVSGTLNVVGSQVSFAGSRILANPGTRTLFVGVGAGAVNTGTDNVFVGSGAGQANTTGGSNSFFGANAGLNNTTGLSNAFFGSAAGQANTGGANAFFGANAGVANTTGNSNAFFGNGAGGSNSTGNENAFFGNFAGSGSTTTNKNSFFGTSAGSGNTGNQNSSFGEGSGGGMQGSFNSFFGQGAGTNSGSGFEDVFVGWFAGSSYGTGSNNTFVGSQAGFTLPVPPNPSGSGNTALGRLANVTAGLSNATAIGAGAQVTQSSSLVLGNSNVKVGIGNTAPQAKLHITEGTSNIAFGLSGCGAGLAAIGFFGPLSCQSYALLGGDGDTYINRPNGGSIHFRQGNFEQVTITNVGTLRLLALGSAGGSQLCWNANNEVSFCSSSLRYKTELSSFRSGMDLVSRLRPIAFKWKEGGAADVGLGAEDVAKVEPRLVTLNDKGEVEGVKYDHLSVVFINAFKEQQAQIDAQRRQIQAQEERLARQEHEIEGLRKLILDRRASGEVR